jgi:hypothetical protein
MSRLCIISIDPSLLNIFHQSSEEDDVVTICCKISNSCHQSRSDADYEDEEESTGRITTDYHCDVKQTSSDSLWNSESSKLHLLNCARIHLSE